MKILYVTTISTTVNAFLIPHIKMLIDEGHQVDVAFNVEQDIKPEVYEMGCKVHEVPFQRSPLKKDNFKAYKILKNIISSEGYELVHTHTPVASAIVRLACRHLCNVRVFYTAHGFHFYSGAPIINWLVYYPVEKFLARYTDTIITINKEDYERAKSKLKTKRVEYIPGIGIDFKNFTAVEVDKNLKSNELGLPKDAFVILSVGELNKNKNHEVIIRAIANLDIPKIHYVICGQGHLEGYLRNLSKELGIDNRVHLLGYRKDIPEICTMSDIFAFPSLREGLGMAALEAMACGLPIITSNVHGIVDYSINEETGYKCSPLDVENLSKHIKTLFNDADKRNKMATNNIEAVKKFNHSNVLELMGQIYA